MNRLFVLLFENGNSKKEHTEYYLPNGEIKDYNVNIKIMMRETFLISPLEIKQKLTKILERVLLVK